jgi:hypothetical protein
MECSSPGIDHGNLCPSRPEQQQQQQQQQQLHVCIEPGIASISVLQQIAHHSSSSATSADYQQQH